MKRYNIKFSKDVYGQEPEIIITKRQLKALIDLFEAKEVNAVVVYGDEIK